MAFLLLAGCATVEAPSGSPIVTIESVRDLGPEVEAVVSYANVHAGKQELNVGLGYTPPPAVLANMPPNASGFYEVLHSQVLKSESGEVTVRLSKAKLGAPFDGVVSVNISEYPHDASWSPLAGDRKELVP